MKKKMSATLAENGGKMSAASGRRSATSTRAAAARAAEPVAAAKPPAADDSDDDAPPVAESFAEARSFDDFLKCVVNMLVIIVLFIAPTLDCAGTAALNSAAQTGDIRARAPAQGSRARCRSAGR